MLRINPKISLTPFGLLLILAFSCGPKPANPHDYQKYIAKGDAFQEQAKYKDAIKNYVKALRIKSNDAAAFKKTAVCFEKLELPDSAITYYEGSIIYNPRDIDAYQKIAAIFYQRRDYYESMSWFDRAMEIGLLTPQSYTLLGNIHNRWKEYPKARDCYQRAVNADSSYAEAHYALGFIDLAAGDTLSAYQSFANARQHGIYAGAAYMLGVIEFNRGRYEQAEPWFNQYLKLAPVGEFAPKTSEFLRLIKIKNTSEQ